MVRVLLPLFRAGFYLPQILPVVIAGVVWGWILQPDGAFNSLLNSLGLSSLTHNWLGDAATALPTVMGIMVWFQIGYPLVIFMAALQRVDPEVLEAAAIDGAGWFQKFYYITIRLIQPEIFVVMLTTTIHALKSLWSDLCLDARGAGHGDHCAVLFRLSKLF